MNPKPYSKYTLEDFMWDHSFRKWVKNPENSHGRFWTKWLEENPDKAHLVTSAREMILALGDDQDDPFEEELSDLWQRITDSNELSDQQIQVKPNNFFRFTGGLRLAAAIAGLLLVSTLTWYSFGYFGQSRYTTHYGEVKTIVLPDQSVVTLNANSTIRYAKDWDGKSQREVWLDGEAFFSVVHTRMHQKFLVHVSNLAVEVVGTQFNVNARRGKTRVVLNEGKVKLRLNKPEAETYEMKPGDLVEVAKPTEPLFKKKVDSESYTAWKANKLVFEEATLREIAGVLEDNYGYQVKFDDPELASLTFTGSVDRHEVQVFLTILERSFGITINKKGNELTFQ